MSSIGSPGSGEVGRLHVTIDANTDQAAAGLREVRVEGERAGGGIGKAFKEGIKPLHSAVQGIRAIVGTATGIASLVAGMVSLTRVFDVFEQAVKRAEQTAVQFQISAQASVAAFAQLGSGGTAIQAQKVIDDITAKQIAATKELQKERSKWWFPISMDEYNQRLKIIDQTANAEKDNVKAAFESFESMRQLIEGASLRLQIEKEITAEANKQKMLAADEADRQAKFLANLFDIGRLVKEEVAAERDKLEIMRQQVKSAEDARKTLKAAFDADTLSADIGRITELLQAIVIQGRVR